MSSKNKVSNKQKDFNHLTEFLWKMLIMAITMLALFMGTLVPALFFASFAASKRNKIDGKILIENDNSDYFIGKMEKEKETAKSEKVYVDIENIFDSKETPSKGFFEEVINKSFKNLNMGLYPRIVNFNGYDKVFDPKNTKLIFFSIMMYYILFNENTEDLWDQNTLGEESFGTFYTGLGFVALNNIIQREPELLPTIKIKDEKGKSYSLTEFLDKVEKWKIMS